jgi:AraC-like DNA-binding protein
MICAWDRGLRESFRIHRNTLCGRVARTAVASRMDSVILARWSYQAVDDASVTVVPDGCRDLIVRCLPGEAPRWLLSPLDDCSRKVEVVAGTFMQGFRLRPGARIDASALLELAKEPRPRERNLGACIHEFTTLSASVNEALECLACEASSVRDAASRLGLSARTLQRLITQETGRAPTFWLRLARARRAGRALLQGQALSEIALAHGFADQAHMTREFRRWFDLTPVQARRTASFQDALQQSGHG